MPSVMTHAVAGIALGVATGCPRRRRVWALSAILPMVADVDILGIWLRIDRASMWWHRGITHSLLAAAVLGAAVAALVARRSPRRPVVLAAYFGLVAATHPLLDMLTSAASGVMLFAPFDTTRYAWPWRPLPVCPIGLAFVSARGGRALAGEALYVWLPALVLAAMGTLLRARTPILSNSRQAS